jgi:oxygen-independent coproporphyrinogen-3 oxidase
MTVDHLYLHVPFCAHRCGYCDFVTVTGNEHLQERYVDALLAELARATPRPRTVFVGGGTPSLLAPPLLARLLRALPPAEEVTVECNPETVTAELAEVLVAGGVTRVSVGAQSFQPHLLRTLERRSSTAAVWAAVGMLRRAGVLNLNLDLMFGVPGQREADLAADLDELLELAPEHVSYYELEAKPGTRFTHAHGPALARQANAMEAYYEAVVGRLRGAGYRWYETANFCRDGRMARHNLGYWLGHDYLGIGVGAVSTVGLRRWQTRPSLVRYLEAVEAGMPAPCEVESLSVDDRALERLMLGLRLDVPLRLNGCRRLIDPAATARLEAAGLVHAAPGALRLSDRGRFLADEVVASLLR